MILILCNILLSLYSHQHDVPENQISRNLVFQISTKDHEGIRIDSVRIFKNWRTKDLIIKQELGINPGDIVTIEQLEKAVSRIWNIGNFANVSYQIDTLKDTQILLRITAQDALTIMPNFTFRGNWQEYNLKVGVNDENFLGRNILLNMAGTFGTLTKDATIKLGIPRQLLYKNMTLRVGYSYGAVQNLKYISGKAVSGVSYLKKNIFLSVGNPFHTDYHYTFSPDLTIAYFSHKTDSTLFRRKIIYPDNYNVKYLGFSLNESIGLINQTRHQHDGILVSASVSYNLGMNRESPDYYEININGKYFKLLNKNIELNGTLSSGFTNARLPSQIIYLGPNFIKGILTGEDWGKSYLTSGIKASFTYLNRDWFALEHSIFVNIGNATQKYSELFRNKPLITTGTGLKLMIPMVPWLAFSLIYAYKGNKNHWFNIE